MAAAVLVDDHVDVSEARIILSSYSILEICARRQRRVVKHIMFMHDVGVNVRSMIRAWRTALLPETGSPSSLSTALSSLLSRVLTLLSSLGDSWRKTSAVLAIEVGARAGRGSCDLDSDIGPMRCRPCRR